MLVKEIIFSRLCLNTCVITSVHVTFRGHWKNVILRKSRACATLQSKIYGICEKTTILNDFESKRSSYRCFQGHILASLSNGFVHALKYIFFSSNNSFFFTFVLRRIACTQTYVIKRQVSMLVNRGHWLGRLA